MAKEEECEGTYLVLLISAKDVSCHEIFLRGEGGLRKMRKMAADETGREKEYEGTYLVLLITEGDVSDWLLT